MTRLERPRSITTDSWLSRTRVTLQSQAMRSMVDDESGSENSISPPAAPTNPFNVSTVAVTLNQPLKKGDRLLVMEAMKMQSTVYAPVAGIVKQLLVQPGQQVEAKDLLLVIE